MAEYPVFLIEATDRERQWLRRFSFTRACGAKPGGTCEAMTSIGEADIVYSGDGYIKARKVGEAPPRSDPRWPVVCQACGRPLQAEDEWQLFGRQIYVRPSDGFRCTLQEAPVGACWDAWWISDRRRQPQPVKSGCGYTMGDDGRSLVVVCPDGHHWYIDARASNCTLPNDDAHHCWVRHGRPEDGTLHVDKAGHTCAAGAGSIDTGKWHGFLQNGKLVGP